MCKKYISANTELMLEWDWKANADLDPTKITLCSHKNVWWKCSKCGNEWKAVIRFRVQGFCRCSKCSKKQLYFDFK